MSSVRIWKGDRVSATSGLLIGRTGFVLEIDSPPELPTNTRWVKVEWEKPPERTEGTAHVGPYPYDRLRVIERKGES
jgi:hypothetical protein